MQPQEPFFPYYINQARLFDLYAILNSGYPEYEEIQSSTANEKRKTAKASSEASGGFHLFKIAGSVDGDYSKTNKANDSRTMHRVQTVTSILNLTINEMSDNKLLHDIKTSKPGSFVLLPVNLKINSIKALINEAKELVALGKDMTALGDPLPKQNGKRRQNDSDLKQIEQIAKVAGNLFDGEEMVHIEENFAVFGNIVHSNLYQAERADIVNIDLQCLAQVKRIFPEGTQLMKNTVFSKFCDKDTKRTIIEAISAINDGKNFVFDTTAIPEISDKPVYQLEIVALFQKMNQSNNT